jgi:hypothetical protein
MTQNNTQEFGITSWATLQNKGDKKEKDEYLKLSQGSNIVRILTDPFEKVVYSFKEWDNDNRKFGDTIMSSRTDDDPIKLMAREKWDQVNKLEEQASQLIAAGKMKESEAVTEQAKALKAKIKERGWSPQTRVLFKVLDRASGRVKLLEAGPGLTGKISAKANSSVWGDPQNWDMEITVNKNAKVRTDYYDVTPVAKTPLTADELKLKEAIDLEEMKRKVTPPTAEKMREYLAKARAKRSGTTGSSTSTVVPSYVSSTPETNDDVSFEPAEIEG